MNPPHDDPGLCEEQRRLLTAAIPSLPIAAERIQATLRSAEADVRRRGARQRLFASAGIGSLVALLAAAGYWRWNGENGDERLTFRAAIDITRGVGDYSRTNVQAALGKVATDLTRMLSRLMEQGALTEDLKATMLEALDSKEPISVPYEQGVEALRWKLDNGGVLTADETTLMKQAIYAAVEATRRLGERRADMREVSNSVCRMFRKYVTVVPLERASRHGK